MPVRKFRDVADLPGSTWYAPGDPRLFAAMARLWEMSRRELAPRFPPGVHKNRSIQEMNARQDGWDAANHAALLERRRRPRG